MSVRCTNFILNSTDAKPTNNFFYDECNYRPQSTFFMSQLLENCLNCFSVSTAEYNRTENTQFQQSTCLCADQLVCLQRVGNPINNHTKVTDNYSSTESNMRQIVQIAWQYCCVVKQQNSKIERQYLPAQVAGGSPARRQKFAVRFNVLRLNLCPPNASFHLNRCTSIWEFSVFEG